MKILFRSALMGTVILMLIAGSSASAADVVHNGVDLWMTVAGFAKTSFAQEPIPAGFFCESSQPFTGTVTFKGAPLAMEPARSLGSIDTVVRRLDDVTFNEKGEGATRIQLMALSLVSTQPIETSCGKYDVAVTLAGEQPTTTMKIVRTDALGGTYTAPLALNVKAVFTPVAGSQGARRELTRRIELGPGSHSVWAYVTTPQYPANVRIDTNGDGKPDTALPVASNFKAGVEPAVLKGQESSPRLAYLVLNDCTCPSPQCPYQSCHCDPNSIDPFNKATGCDHLHCIWTCANVPGRACVCGLSPD
ncbi:MAG TPA: hypothetical protein VGM86_30840 [Thermoanaerobaculia bacterium]